MAVSGRSNSAPPQPETVQQSPLRTTFAPSASSAPQVAAMSSEEETPVMRDVPSASPAQSSARCASDLDGGTRTAPEQTAG